MLRLAHAQVLWHAPPRLQASFCRARKCSVTSTSHALRRHACLSARRAVCACSPKSLHRTRTSPSAARRSDIFVSPEWLQDRLDDVTVLDVRGRVETATDTGGSDSNESDGPPRERSHYSASYDDYLGGHVPVRRLSTGAACPYHLVPMFGQGHL